MNKKIPLSVVIVTKNEEKNIKECLESAKWAEEVLWCVFLNKADAVVVETNFGGDMARDNIRNAKIIIGHNEDDEPIYFEGKNLHIVEVTASRGKEVRAQPVATLFQLGKMHHVGHYQKLHSQPTALMVRVSVLMV